MKIFLLMLQFFTRIPINKAIDIKEGDFPKGIIYFPFIGLVVGSINALFFFLSSKLFEGIIPIILVLISNAFITGALHLDGFADTCDGIFSARKREKMLEIMRDSRIGTNGMLGLFFLLILKIAFLEAMPREIILVAIILLPTIGRTAMAITLFGAKYAREGEGLGDLFIGKTNLMGTTMTVVIALILCFGLFNLYGVISLLLVLLLGYITRHFFIKQLGGLTGDLLGAINEICEIVALPIILWIYHWGLLS